MLSHRDWLVGLILKRTFFTRSTFELNRVDDFLWNVFVLLRLLKTIYVLDLRVFSL